MNLNHQDKVQTTSIGGQLPRETVASDVLRFAHVLADRASSVAVQVEQKLEPVTRSANPDCTKDACAEEAYPPLFSELRSCFYRIESALNAIDNTLSRTEL
jgi:hypothetical protein